MIGLTPRIVAFLGTQEGITLEAYLDPRVWTWAMGIAATSGANVLQYRSRPTTLDAALRASVDWIESRFMPAVQKAFAGHELTEAQLAAALSFHWNTGAILTAQWVKDIQEGKPATARADLIGNYQQGGILTARRKREAALFFDGAWPDDMRVPIWGVRKPSYLRSAKPQAVVDMIPALQQIMGGK